MKKMNSSITNCCYEMIITAVSCLIMYDERKPTYKYWGDEMINVFDVAKSIIHHVEQHYSEDIALIAYYGSYAQGNATKRSDLDLFFIPATPRGYDVCLQFIVDDISFDFWPLNWERAERMATFQETFTTLIADCKLLYVRSEEDRERFMQLRSQIAAMQQSEQTNWRVEKAEAELRQAYLHLYKLNRARDFEDITYYRTEAYEVLTKVCNSLALLNGTYFMKGYGKNKGQILGFPLIPKSLESLMDTITHTADKPSMVGACETLVADTLDVVMAQQELHKGLSSYPDRMKGYFEEVKGVLDKIVTSCEMNDYDTAYYSAIHVQEETARFLYYAETGQWPSTLAIHPSYQSVYKQLGFPELIAALHPEDLTILQTAAVQFSSQLERYLQSRGVRIHRFSTVAQMEMFLQNMGGK